MENVAVISAFVALVGLCVLVGYFAIKIAPKEPRKQV